MDTAEALSQFFTHMARAADDLARNLSPRDASHLDPKIVAKLGTRQREIYDTLVGAAAPRRTGEIARTINYDFSNCYMTLRRLEQLGVVELVPAAKPQQWRLAGRPKDDQTGALQRGFTKTE